MSIESAANFWRVRIRSPKLFSTFRTPEWASSIAQKFTGDKTSKVTLGKLKGSTKFQVQSILISKNIAKTQKIAVNLAERIRKEIESGKKKNPPVKQRKITTTTKGKITTTTKIKANPHKTLARFK